MSRSRSKPALRGGVLALIWIGVPAAWLVTNGLVGTQLDPNAALYGTAVLFVSLFVGLPLAVFSLSRALLRSEASRAAVVVRVRRPLLRQMRPLAIPEGPRTPGPPIGKRRRFAALLLPGLMFAVALASWTAVPIGWLWVGSQFAASGRAGVAPYALIVVGIPTTILSA
jgi:hypothetical protein